MEYLCRKWINTKHAWPQIWTQNRCRPCVGEKHTSPILRTRNEKYQTLRLYWYDVLLQHESRAEWANHWSIVMAPLRVNSQLKKERRAWTIPTCMRTHETRREEKNRRWEETERTGTEKRRDGIKVERTERIHSGRRNKRIHKRGHNRERETVEKRYLTTSKRNQYGMKTEHHRKQRKERQQVVHTYGRSVNDATSCAAVHMEREESSKTHGTVTKHVEVLAVQGEKARRFAAFIWLDLIFAEKLSGFLIGNWKESDRFPRSATSCSFQPTHQHHTTQRHYAVLTAPWAPSCICCGKRYYSVMHYLHILLVCIWSFCFQLVLSLGLINPSKLSYVSSTWQHSSDAWLFRASVFVDVLL